jgi:hypothetical protein
MQICKFVDANEDHMYKTKDMISMRVTQTNHHNSIILACFHFCWCCYEVLKPMIDMDYSPKSNLA